MQVTIRPKSDVDRALVRRHALPGDARFIVVVKDKLKHLPPVYYRMIAADAAFRKVKDQAALSDWTLFGWKQDKAEAENAVEFRARFARSDKGGGVYDPKNPALDYLITWTA